MDGILHDLRVGLRLLAKDRSFTVTVAITLALCIGANVALFAVVSHVLLRPLPMPEADRLAMIGNAYPNAGAANLRAVAVPDYFDRLRETTAFAEQALYNNASVTIDQGGTPTRVRAMNVTPSFFRVLGVPPLLGRTFNDEEGEIGNQSKLVLSCGHEWSYIPHFYRDFYVFQYATSFTASSALAAKVKSGDAAATTRYLTFISSGGSRYPIDLLKEAGVDMTTDEPLDLAMKEMNRVMDEMETILSRRQRK